jgi:hypothetical protein
MGIQELILGLVLLVLIIGPVFYFQSRQKKKRKAILDSLIHLNGHMLSISEYDFWNDFYRIGLDASQNKLLHMKKSEKEEVKQLVDLTTATKCVLQSLYTDVNGNRLFESIKLQIVFSDSRQPAVELEFYSNQDSFSVKNELQLATKWQKIVEEQLQESNLKEAIVA